MIAGVATVKDEADIIGYTTRHLLEQGVDRVWVMDWSEDDATRDVLSDIPEVTVVTGQPVPFYWAHTPDYIGRLSDIAGDEWGAEWVIPFDADEFWTGNGCTVAEALAPIAAETVDAEIRQYADFDHLQLRSYPWTKVAYRYRPGLRLVAGNHHVEGGGCGPPSGILIVHELKFRGFDHFVRKVRRQVPWSPDSPFQSGADTAQLAVSGGVHLRSDLTDEELWQRWVWLNAEVQACPIPSKSRLPTI